jgi:hypothetical protein
MPPVANVKGQPISPAANKMIVPEPIKDEPIPLSATLPKVDKVDEPELAIPVDQLPVKSQDELAAISIATQTVAQKRNMVPSTEIAKPPLTHEQRVEQAKLAAETRWSKRYNWEEAPIEDALEYLAEIRLETERGGLVLQRRVSEMRIEKVKCFGCDNIINVGEGRWATYRTRNNYETGLTETQYACSAACALKLNKEFTHPIRTP